MTDVLAVGAHPDDLIEEYGAEDPTVFQPVRYG